MKKLISVMIALMLIVSCLPLTVSAAKETSIEQKFRLLLDDMEIAYAYHQPDSYYYEELAHMDTWTLICGGMNDLNPSNQAHKMHYAAVGDKLIASNTVSEPFKSGFGVFDSRSGAFYDLTDAWERDFPGLLDAWNNLPSSEWVRGECSAALIGDADGDGKVNILDATRIQRIIAKLDADHTANPTKEDFFYGWPIGSICDYDRDGKITVLDATSIQRKLVSLPKVLEFNTLCCCPTDAYSASPAEPSAARILRTSAEEFDFTNRYGDNSYDLTLFHDDPSFHEKSVLVGAFVSLPDENDRVKSIDRVSLGTDGVLTVDLTYGKGSGESSDWMILLGITRAFVDDIRDVKVNITRENPFGTSLIAPITAERPNVPDDLNADGYHAIDPEFLYYAVPDSLVYNYPYPEPMQEPAHVGDGYLMLLRSRSDLEYYLPEIDTEGKLDDAFFSEYAVLAAFVISDREHSFIELSDVAVYNGTTLCADTRIETNNWGAFDDDDMYDLVDETIWSLYRVKQSEVRDVDKLVCWGRNITALSAAITPQEERASAADVLSAAGSSVALEPNVMTLVDGSRNVLDIDKYGYIACRFEPGKNYLSLIRSRSEFCDHFYAFDEDGVYTDEFFKDNALIAVYGQGDCTDAAPTLSDVAVIDGTTLYADAQIAYPHPEDPFGDSEPFVWLFAQVKQSDVKNVDTIALWNSAETTAVVAQIPKRDRITVEIPDDPAAEGYTELSAEPITVPGPRNDYEEDYWNELIPAPELYDIDGYLLLIPDRAALEKCLPGFDQQGQYDDAFFADYAIVGMIGQGTEENDTAELDRIAVKGNTLYARAYIENHYETNDEGEIVMQPSAPVVRTFRRVSKSDVAGVKTIVVWRKKAADRFFETSITDDKKVDACSDEPLAYESLSTATRVFEWDYQEYGDGQAFLNQPYRVAIIRSYAQYTAYFGSDRFDGFDAYTGLPIYKNIGGNRCPLDEMFFKDNALIVGVGYFCTGDEYLSFDEIRQSDDAEVLTVRFNRYTYGDLHPNESYAANILGYCFAAASVPKDAVKYVSAVQMLPQVKKLPNDVYTHMEYGVLDSQDDLYSHDTFSKGFIETDEAVYIDSADKLKGTIDSLLVDYLGNPYDRGSIRFPIETDAEYDDAWFETHAMIAARVYRGGSSTMQYVTDLERSAAGNLLLEVTLMHDGFDTPDNAWSFIFLGVEKQEGDPTVTIVTVHEENFPEPMKPIIYLYPEQETELTVTLGKPEELTCTYPAYNSGWHITAKPDGTLIGENGRSYYALYWESKSKTPVSMPDGFVVRGEDTASFLEEKLAILGLSEREAQEFIIYWLPQMQDNEYNLIRFATADEIERIMPLSFSVQPDTVIRVLMQYKALDEPIDVPEQKLTAAPERKGFVVVEWGGTLIGQ